MSIASKAYTAGDVILESKPLIHVVDNEFKGKHCDHCLKESDDLKKCAKCHKMHYCDKECQQNDWKYHKNECKVFRHKNFLMDRTTNDERILLRLWICIQSDPEFASRRHLLADGRQLSLNDIEVDTKKLLRNKEQMEVYKVTLYNFECVDVQLDRQQLLRWFGLMKYRWAGVPLMWYAAKDLLLKYIKPVGYGVFIGLYGVGHSCVPNSCQTTYGMKLQLRAMKPIAANDKLTITFTDLKLNKFERQKDLRQRFGIVCDCDKCRLNLDKDIDYDLLYSMLDEGQVNYLMVADQVESRSSSLLPLKFHGIDYEMNYNLILIMKAVYGQYFPFISQSMVFNFICFALSRYAEQSMIKLWHKEVEDNLRVTHDPKHPIFKIFQKVYETAVKNNHI